MNFIQFSKLLTEISLNKRVAARMLRKVVGKKLPASVRMQVSHIDQAIAALKNNEVHPLVNTLFGGHAIDKKDQALKKLYSMRSNIIRATKEDNKDMIWKLALYGAIPPVVGSAIGVGASYHAAKKYSTPYVNPDAPKIKSIQGR